MSIKYERHKSKGGNIPAALRGAGMALAATMVATMALAPAAVHAQQQIAVTSPVSRVTERVTVGQSQDVRTNRGFADIIVSDPDVAVISPLTDQSFSILGKKIGTTRVTAYDANKQPVKIFDVQVSNDLSGLAMAIAQIGGAGIKVSPINGHIMLSGTAPDAATLDKAVMIARQFAPDPINIVSVMQQQQVELEVRFIEIDRQASSELGVQWNMFGSTTANIGDNVAASKLPVTGVGPNVTPQSLTVSPIVSAGVLSGAAPFGFLVSQLSNRLQVSVNALEQKGLARSLADPNLVALSGQTASFNVGGEIPVETASATGTPSFGYKPYGVGLSFTPTVLSGGLINLMIKPAVTELDWANAVQGQPALTDRSASTTLELRDGQSFMLGGLLQNINNAPQQELPWLGDLPVLGALFRSSQYQKNETDLVIVVTPHIVRPLASNQVAHTPLDHTLPGNDVDFFLMGNAEVSPAVARLAVDALNRPYVGHILDLPKNGGAYVSARD